MIQTIWTLAHLMLITAADRGGGNWWNKNWKNVNGPYVNYLDDYYEDRVTYIWSKHLRKDVFIRKTQLMVRPAA